MQITRTLALRLLKRQEWGKPRSAPLRRRRSALSALRRRLAPNCGDDSSSSTR